VHHGAERPGFPIAFSGALSMLPRFDAANAPEITGRDAVTIFEGVPTMYAAILHHPQADPAMAASLRVRISGRSETSPVASFNEWTPTAHGPAHARPQGLPGATYRAGTYVHDH
jgi:acyl-CoA synthetase (AMP-forming)/AMP-acid ligase II